MEDDLMEDSIWIQRRFTKVTDQGIEFKDAIILPEEEYNALSEFQIEVIKEERFDNWKESINNSSEEV